MLRYIFVLFALTWCYAGRSTVSAALFPRGPSGPRISHPLYSGLYIHINLVSLFIIVGLAASLALLTIVFLKLRRRLIRAQISLLQLERRQALLLHELRALQKQQQHGLREPRKSPPGMGPRLPK